MELKLSVTAVQFVISIPTVRWKLKNSRPCSKRLASPPTLAMPAPVRQLVVHEVYRHRRTVELPALTGRRFQMKMAPTIILWYVNNDRLAVLVTVSPSWSTAALWAMAGRRSTGIAGNPGADVLLYWRSSEGARHDRYRRWSGHCQATLIAFEQGLGTCCQGSGDWSRVQKAFNMPENCRIAVAQTVGYPLETPMAVASVHAYRLRSCSN